MNREQSLNQFFNSFGVAAYDENTVPDDAPNQRIVYELIVNNFGTPTYISLSIYDRSTSWKSVTDIQNMIEQRVGLGGLMLVYDTGAVWIKKGSPFAQRYRDDNDDSYRRIIINLELEYLEG